MSEPYIGEIRMFAGTFAPVGWEPCDGHELPISEYEALYNLIGTTYGGDGQSTFALPNLCGRIPIHQGQGPGISQNYQLGATGGVTSTTLTTSQMPSHTHTLTLPLNTPGTDSVTPAPNLFFQQQPAQDMYLTDPPEEGQGLNLGIGQAGGNQPHENRQPFLAVTFIIAVYGIYPQPN